MSRTRMAVTLMLLAGCAQTHHVRPLGRGNGIVAASLGGPLLKLGGLTVPAPIVDLTGGYGVRDDLEVLGRIDVTGLAFGVVHVEPGVAWHPVVREGGAVPTVTLAGSVHVLTDFRTARVVPQLGAAAAWRIARKHMVYAGADLGLGFGGEGRRFAPLWGPFVGGEARVGRVGLALELKWVAPHVDVVPAAPDWVSPGGRGFLSLLVGVNVYLGKVK